MYGLSSLLPEDPQGHLNRLKPGSCSIGKDTWSGSWRVTRYGVRIKNVSWTDRTKIGGEGMAMREALEWAWSAEEEASGKVCPPEIKAQMDDLLTIYK